MEIVECPKCGEHFEPNEKYWVPRRMYESMRWNFHAALYSGTFLSLAVIIAGVVTTKLLDFW